MLRVFLALRIFKHFALFSRRFRRKCTTLTVASFFSSVQRDRSTFSNIINLNYGRPKHTRNARTSSKTKKSPSRTSKTGSPFGVFHSDFFSALCDFFLEFIGFHQRVSPSFVSIFCNTMDVKKSQRVPRPFYIKTRRERLKSALYLRLKKRKTFFSKKT